MREKLLSKLKIIPQNKQIPVEDSFRTGGHPPLGGGTACSFQIRRIVVFFVGNAVYMRGRKELSYWHMNRKSGMKERVE